MYLPRFKCWLWVTVPFTLTFWIAFPTLVSAQEDDQSGVSPQVISLPSGPGSLEGLGESFEPNLSTGTASYPYPFVVPLGVNDFEPNLTIRYNGGNPNGPWGLGWMLDVPYIQRQTDKGLPAYSMDDRFIFYTGEELVSIGNDIYRFENESSFIRFRWLPETESWEAHTPNGTLYEFGPDNASRITIPFEGETETFRWALKRQVDVYGNEIRYFYQKLGDERATYLTEVRYNFSSDGRHNAVKIEYEPRPDTFSDRTSRAAIIYNHRATHIDISALGEFVRSYQFDYFESTSTHPHSLLQKITLIGDDQVSELPSTTFTYTQFDPQEYRVVDMENAPFTGLSDPNTTLIDMTYDGLPDFVYTPSDFEQQLYVNRGNGRWDEDIQVDLGVAQLGSADVRIADMNGDGQVDLLQQVSDSEVAYFATEPKKLWDVADLVSYDAWLFPYFSIRDANIKLLDVNNDKLIDILELGESVYNVWLAPDDNVWSAAPDHIIDTVANRLPQDVDTIRFGDMTGDRLQDLVVIRDGYISYFPHNGAGNYADEIVPENAPTWLTVSEIDSLLLGDINNDGLDDLIQPRSGQVRYWLSLGGSGFSELYTVPATGDSQTILPELIPDRTSVQLADMNGDGSTDLVYGQPNGTIQYIDFNVGEQPNLLKTIDNGLGRTYLIDYKPSTDFYTADWDTGNSWESSVPFPVQVVSKMSIQDSHSGDVYVTDYTYRNGYYDGMQKEFRGFAEMIQTQQGDITAPTTVIHHRYDTGMAEESRKGILLEELILGVDGSCQPPVSNCYSRAVHQPTTLTIAENNSEQVTYSYVEQSDHFIFENQDDPVQLRQMFKQDIYGNQTEAFNYGQVCADDPTCGDDERLTYTNYALNLSRWLLRYPAKQSQTDETGAFVSERISYYDGEDYVGLAQGEITKGNLTRQTDNLGPLEDNHTVETVRQAFDDYGNVVGIQDANGNLTTISYDSLVHTFPVAEYIHLGDKPSLSVTASYHFGFGQILATTNFNGHVSAYEYDIFGRLSKIALTGDSLDLPTQEFVYDLGSPHSSIETILRENSGETAVRRSITYFDGLGRALQTRREAEDSRFAVESATTFNAHQSAHLQYLPYFDDTIAYTEADPSLAHTETIYDPFSRAIKVINPDDTFTSVTYLPLKQVQYDEEDNRPESPHFGTPKTLIYDGLERLTGVDEWNRSEGIDEIYSTRYSYDLLDNLTQFVDAAGNVKSLQYDGLSRKLFMDDPDRGEMHYVYDDFGNLIETTDAKGQTIRYEYDRANRLTAEKWVQQDSSLYTYAEFHYDHELSKRHPEAKNTLGQITYITDEAGEAYFTYDVRGNTVGESRFFIDENLEFITLMGYDATDRLSTLTYPDGVTIDYRYNRQGLLESIPGFVDDIDYIASGQHDTMRYANGVLRDYDHDSRLRLGQLRSTSSTSTLQDLNYAFDGNSNIVNIADGRPDKIDDNNQAQTYQYDALYRLTQATGTYGVINYGYNSIGNMMSKTSTSADQRLNIGVMRYGENGAGPHALTTAREISQRYDLNGNLIEKGGMTLSWDFQDRLRGVKEGDSNSTYVYDFGGQRMSQTVVEGNTISRVLYPNSFSELRDSMLINYIFADGMRVARQERPLAKPALASFLVDSQQQAPQDAGTREWYLADHLGGTNLLANEQGQIVSENSYYPFGLVRPQVDLSSINYGFTGKELDETGFNYFEARYYDPIFARFMSVDPLLSQHPKNELKNPQILNNYSYSLNNPINVIDSLGLVPRKKIKLTRSLFDKLWKNYPVKAPKPSRLNAATHAKNETQKLLKSIGINAPSAVNSCAARISCAMTASGMPISEKLAIKSGAAIRRSSTSGHVYLLGTPGMAKYLTAAFGKGELLKGKNLSQELAGRRGIVHFDVKGWSDAYGHVALWDGSKFRSPEDDFTQSLGIGRQNANKDGQYIKRIQFFPVEGKNPPNKN